MRIGYACVNLSVGCSSSRTFRLASYSADRMRSTVAENLACLQKILEFNAAHDIRFFRVTSDLIPFASHPICTFPWRREFAGAMGEIGEFARKEKMRLSMHPDQFVVISSPDREVVARSAAELIYHAEVLDLLQTGPEARIQIHLGGVYGDRRAAMSRFAASFRELPAPVRRRLVIENDDRLYRVSHCLQVHRETGLPVVVDVFHFQDNNDGEDLEEALKKAAATWSAANGFPIVDYSSQDPGKRPGSHAAFLDSEDFARFLTRTEGIDFDIMIEIKDKEKSALEAIRLARGGGAALKQTPPGS